MGGLFSPELKNPKNGGINANPINDMVDYFYSKQVSHKFANDRLRRRMELTFWGFSSGAAFALCIFLGACLCENAPGPRLGAFNVEFAAMAAPRPLLLIADTHDWTKTRG